MDMQASLTSLSGAQTPPPTPTPTTDIDVSLLGVPQLKDDVRSFLALSEQHPDVPAAVLSAILARPADERPALLSALRRGTPAIEDSVREDSPPDADPNPAAASTESPGILGRRRREEPAISVEDENGAVDPKRSRCTDDAGDAAPTPLRRLEGRPIPGPLVLHKDLSTQSSLGPLPLLSPRPEEECWATPCGEFQFVFPQNLQEPPPPLPLSAKSFGPWERALTAELETSLAKWKETRDLAHWEQYDHARRQRANLRCQRAENNPPAGDGTDWLHPTLSPQSFRKRWRSLEEEKQRHERMLKQLAQRRAQLDAAHTNWRLERLAKKQVQQAKLGEELRRLEELQQLRRMKRLQRMQQLHLEHETHQLDHEIRMQRIKAQDAALSSSWGDLSDDGRADRSGRLLALGGGSTPSEAGYDKELSKTLSVERKSVGRFQERKKWFQQALLSWQQKREDEDREGAGAAQGESSAWFHRAWQPWHLWGGSASQGRHGAQDATQPGSPDPFPLGGSFFSF